MTKERIAECAVLGYLMMESNCLHYMEDIKFSCSANVILYNAIRHLAKKHGTIDVCKLREYLDSRGQLELIGGVEYLAKLIQSSSSLMDVAYLISIINKNI
jgi:replicative DNA helicase